MTFQPAGNYYDKYHTRNPIARKLMAGFLDSFDRLLQANADLQDAFEVGCGEGELSIRMARRGLRVSGVDIAAEAVDEARRRVARSGLDIELSTGSIYDLDPVRHRSDLVVCCEVLEHLDHTQAALDVLHALCGKRLIASVPREPIWRALNVARGKYIGDLGNTPGHVQHWSRAGFVDLLESRFRILQVLSPLPWTMVLCEPRN